MTETPTHLPYKDQLHEIIKPLTDLVGEEDISRGRFGFPIMTDAVRGAMVRELGEAIKGKSPWAFAYVDLDGLKEINTKHGRQAGDEAIIWGGGRVLDFALTVRGFGASVFVLRDTHAADEWKVFIVGEGDVEGFDDLVHHALEKLGEREERDGVVLSMTATVVTSTMPRLQKYIKETRKWLFEVRGRMPFGFFHQIEDLLNVSTAFDKIVKEVAGTPDKLAEAGGGGPTLEELNNRLAKKFGGGRVSEAALRVILDFHAICTLLSVREALSPAARQRLKEAGVDFDAVSIGGIGDIIKLFKRIFALPELGAGIPLRFQDSRDSSSSP